MTRTLAGLLSLVAFALLFGVTACGADSNRSDLCEEGTWSDRGAGISCAKWTECAPGQYVGEMGTSTRDQTCLPCPSGTFNTAANAASCTMWTSCTAGTHVSSEPTASHDRACEACSAGTYTSGPDEATCVLGDACPAGTIQSAPAMATMPPSCTACAAGEYCAGGMASAIPCSDSEWDHDGSPATACIALSICPEGTYVSSAGSATTDRACMPCASGSFSNSPNEAACTPYNDCPAGTTQTAAGTSTAPPTCASCPSGTYCSGGTAAEIACGAGTWDDDANTATPCVARTTCVAGQYVTNDGSATTDRTCSACPSGTYSTAANSATCTPWTVCPHGQMEGTAGTATSDRVCVIDPSCTNLCKQQVTCSGTGDTTISGTVYAPNGVDPLPGVYVYVPNGMVQPFASGVQCDRCAGTLSGSPLVSTRSAADGTFTLSNAPAGASIPLVIQTGRWRRQIVVTNVTACTNKALTASQSRLPRNKSEGDIPHIAIVTANADSLECVFRKIGVDDAELTNSSSTGRINLFPTGSGNGAYAATSAPTESTLMSSTATLSAYDMLVQACPESEVIRTSTELSHFTAYVNAGGRVFGEHFTYTWLYTNGAMAGVASWQVKQAAPAPQVATIDTSFARGAWLAGALYADGASTTYGQISVSQLGHDVNAVVAPTKSFLSTSTPNAPIALSFDTQVGASTTCGRVTYADYHGGAPYSLASPTFPTECTAGPMTAQEKLIELQLFDVGSCIE